MGAFDLKQSANYWNYHNPKAEGYRLTLAGTVIELSNPQARDFKTKQLKYWEDSGKPIRNFAFTILDSNGEEWKWVISQWKKSAAMKAVITALDPQGTRVDSVPLTELLGKQVKITTEDGSYNSANPRPFYFSIDGDGDTTKVRGAIDLSKDDNNQQQEQQQQQQQQLANPQAFATQQPQVQPQQQVQFPVTTVQNGVPQQVGSVVPMQQGQPIQQPSVQQPPVQTQQQLGTLVGPPPQQVQVTSPYAEEDIPF